MTGYRSERVVSIVSFLVVATMLLAIAHPRVAYAINPDIPRMQAGAERGSLQQQIELAAAYLAGRGVQRDEKQAAYWYQKARTREILPRSRKSATSTRQVSGLNAIPLAQPNGSNAQCPADSLAQR